MIFVTIGTQAPFDRFIRSIDNIAVKINEPIIAQVYKSNYRVKNIKAVDFLSPDEYNSFFDEARIIVSHAGMGTIITALVKKKPIIVMPRLASFKEHRNDHQIVTAMKMNELGYVYVAYDSQQLENLILKTDLHPLYELKEFTPKELTKSILEFIKNSIFTLY
jgi:UDP-N-acetylglucosamine transferase subunit ALG13